MKWIAWSLLLLIQNASFTLVSRARNSGSFGYHAVAAVFSNGIWFASQIVLIDIVVRSLKTPAEIAVAGAIYIASTVVGSVSMHYVSVRWIEKGKRKVGS